MRTALTMSSSERLAPACICNNIHPTWNLKYEFLIGKTDAFLQIRKGKARAPTLGVGRGQPPQRQRRAVDEQNEPVVIGLRRFGNQLERLCPRGRCRGYLTEGRREVAHQVALAGEKKRRRGG